MMHKLQREGQQFIISVCSKEAIIHHLRDTTNPSLDALDTRRAYWGPEQVGPTERLL